MCSRNGRKGSALQLGGRGPAAGGNLASCDIYRRTRQRQNTRCRRRYLPTTPLTLKVVVRSGCWCALLPCMLACCSSAGAGASGRTRAS